MVNQISLLICEIIIRRVMNNEKALPAARPQNTTITTITKNTVIRMVVVLCLF